MSDINELFVLLSDKQQKELCKRAELAGYDDDLAFLQLNINQWLEVPCETIADGLAKALNEQARLFHTEK